MNTKHTPGKWHIGRRAIGRAVYSDAHGAEICVSTSLIAPDEELANMRLVASAPELLEALQACLGPLQDAYNQAAHSGHATNASRAFIAAKQAILKATGGKE